ncbi:hypothetical protein PMIN06_012528 [Paraphaeosphaeria minitans]
MEKTQLSRDEKSDPIFALDKYSALPSDILIIHLPGILGELRRREGRYSDCCSTMIAQLQELALKPSFDSRNMVHMLMGYLDSMIDIQKEEETQYGKAMKVTGRLTSYGPREDAYALTIMVQDGNYVETTVRPQEYWEGIISMSNIDIAAKQSPDIQQDKPTFLTNGTVFTTATQPNDGISYWRNIFLRRSGSQDKWVY